MTTKPNKIYVLTMRMKNWVVSYCTGLCFNICIYILRLKSIKQQ